MARILKSKKLELARLGKGVTKLQERYYATWRIVSITPAHVYMRANGEPAVFMTELKAWLYLVERTMMEQNTPELEED